MTVVPNGLRCFGLTAPFVVDRSINRHIVEAYIETHLAPTRSKGDVVILDNLVAHKSPKAEAAIKARGAWMLFLPPYSPDLNPDRDGLLQAEGSSAGARYPHHRRPLARHRRYLRLLPPTECQNYFEAAGHV